MGLREKIERKLAPLNFPEPHKATHDSWGAPLKPKEAEVSDRQPEDVSEPDGQAQPDDAQRTQRRALRFLGQMMTASQPYGITGGLAREHQRASQIAPTPEEL